MTLACLGHWYLSLLYLAPVVLVVGGLAILSKLEARRERASTQMQRQPGAGHQQAGARAGG